MQRGKPLVLEVTLDNCRHQAFGVFLFPVGVLKLENIILF
jgi:hypothetical protein